MQNGGGALFALRASAPRRSRELFPQTFLFCLGLNLETGGDPHLYLDTKAGGTAYAYDPYTPIVQASSLGVMPERRQYQSSDMDRQFKPWPGG